MTTTATPTFLKLTGRGTNMLFVLFAIVHLAVTVYGLRDTRVPVIALAALACCLIAGYLTTLPREEPYPRHLALIVIALTTAASFNVWNLPDAGWPGWATWMWGAVSFVVWMLTLRGRAGWAWIGFAIMVANTVLWAQLVGRGWLEGVNFVIRSAALVLVVWLFSILLGRTRSAIRQLQRTELSRLRSEAAAAAALEEQNTRLDHLRALATPALERIMTAEVLTDDDRRAFTLVEAALRDQLRASNLATAPVTDAASRARARGVDVSLLDDRKGAEVPLDVRERIETTLVAQLDAAESGRVVARLLPDGRDAVATVLATDGQDTTRVSIAPTA